MSKRNRPPTANMILRMDAYNRGEVTYLSPSPCKRCNGTERYVNRGGCVVCMKKLSTAYARKLTEDAKKLRELEKNGLLEPS